MFIPILRHEINTYVDTWNEHKIRPQFEKFNHVAGRPNTLYFDTNNTVSRCGWEPDHELLGQLKESVSNYGRFPS